MVMESLELRFAVRSDSNRPPVRFQLARFESQGQKPLESLLRLYYFLTFEIGLKSHDSIRWRFRIATVIRIARFGTSKSITNDFGRT